MPQASNHARAVEIRGNIQRTCSFCRTRLGDNDHTCPNCGRAAVEQVRRRVRPEQTEIARIPSQGLLKEYIITQNSIDGALNCNCPSFEEQNHIDIVNGRRPEIPFGFCKHTLQVPREILNGAIERFNAWKRDNGDVVRSPSRNQMALLAPFNVNIHDRLSDNQAYLILANALLRQGINFFEYERLMLSRGSASILPKLVFGVEIECFYGRANGGQQAFIERVLAEEVPIVFSGYNHNLSKDWKIVSDASLRPTNAERHAAQEIVSPPLYGAYGFGQIEKVLRALAASDGAVNKSCGLHVHLNADGVSEECLARLMEVWIQIEKKIIYGLVPPSRRQLPYSNNRGVQEMGGTYCRAITAADLSRCRSEGSRCFNAERSNDHYMSLGFAALGRHGSVEIRSAAGTILYDKIKNWVIMLLKLVDSVWKRNITSDQFTRCRSIEEFLDLIGMDTATAISQIIRSRNWCIDRFTNNFRWHESETFQQIIRTMPTSPARTEQAEDRIEEPETPAPANPFRMGQQRQQRQQQQEREPMMGSLATAFATAKQRYQRHQISRPLTERDPNQPNSHIVNICARGAYRRIDAEIIAAGMPRNRWEIQSRSNPSLNHGVTYAPGLKQLRCTCRSYRRRSAENRCFCSHVAAVARFIYFLDQVQEEMITAGGR